MGGPDTGLAERLTNDPAIALGLMRQAAVRALDMNLDDALAAEAVNQEARVAAEDFQEGFFRNLRKSRATLRRAMMIVQFTLESAKLLACDRTAQRSRGPSGRRSRMTSRMRRRA